MQIIYVDDEQPALDNFRLTVAAFSDVEDLHLFSEPDQALEWVSSHRVDAAFLDMEMTQCHGLELARRFRKQSPNIRIIFVTAYSQYALDAFGVDAVGYVLKPYSAQDIRHELDKAARIRAAASHHVEIQTIPDFVLRVDDETVHFSRPRQEELLALLVDRGGTGLTAGEAIACLWPDRPADGRTQALYRMTAKRLQDTLRECGLPQLIRSDGRKRYLDTEDVDCDLYRILAGDKAALLRFNGEYLRRWTWAEERCASLNNLKEHL